MIVFLTDQFEGKAAADSTGLKAQQLANLQHYAKLCGHETLKFAPYMGAANAEKGFVEVPKHKNLQYRLIQSMETLQYRCVLAF